MKMKVPFFDLHAQFRSVEGELRGKGVEIIDQNAGPEEKNREISVLTPRRVVNSIGIPFITLYLIVKVFS